MRQTVKSIKNCKIGKSKKSQVILEFSCVLHRAAPLRTCKSVFSSCVAVSRRKSQLLIFRSCYEPWFKNYL